MALSIGLETARMLWGVTPIGDFCEAKYLLRGGRLRHARFIQHFPHFAGQRGRRERFLQKRRAGVQPALLDDGVLGVAGGEKNPRVRRQRPHPVSQFLAAHVRHDDIGEQQINVAAAALLFQAQGFDTIGRRQNRVTQPS